MLSEKIILTSFSLEELKEIVGDAVNEKLIERDISNKKRELMNAKQLCEFLGIHISTLNTWKAEGKIPFKRLGKRIFFHREEVLAALINDGSYSKSKELK
ncbi:helix-turn-helix domain-containing protein [Bacteroidota bacterium]